MTDHRPSPSLHFIGNQHKVVVVDHAHGDVASVRAIAAALSPFPAAVNFYPGLRRVIVESDGEAWSYVSRLAQVAAPYIAGAFDCRGFTLIEASFSVVTASREGLSQPQRSPHFDSTDPDYVALLHYLGDVPGSGTAFFRQRSTGIEQIDERNVDRFVAAAQRETGATRGYIPGSTDHFEEIARFDAVADRLLVYRGSLLHSGIIPDELRLDPDPLKGRLTANYFVRLQR